MTGLRKYPQALDDQWANDLVDFLGGPTSASLIELDASRITSGRFALARMPAAAVNKFIRSQGVGSDPIYDDLALADIPRLDLTKIPRGTTGLVIKAKGAGADAVYEAVDWAELSGKPTTFAPSAHQLDSSTFHTVSGLTAGHFLKALTVTTFGFAAHGLSYGDVGAAAASHNHAATDITSAILDAARIPNLDAAKITTGTFPLARLPKPDSCQVRRTTNQSIANAAWTFVTLPDSEDWDYVEHARLGYE